MSGTPDFGKTAKQEAYRRFLEGVVQEDSTAVNQTVDAGSFAAVLPNRGRMSLDQFREHTRSLRNEAPDLGQDVTVLNSVEDSHALVVLYRSIFTFAGQRVNQMYIDWVTFNDAGEIVEIRIMHDLGDAQQQVFGTPLPRRR